MVNVTKASDIIILVVDCYFGLELETFEFLTLAVTNGCPRILCVLTHLDLFKNWKSLRKAKKRIKKRLKLELNIRSKIFFFSGITINEKYLKREISNVTRYLSNVFLYPSFLQKNTSYLIVSALRIKQLNNKNFMLCFGFSKGKVYKNSDYFYSYIPGIGNINMSHLNIKKFQKESSPTVDKLDLKKFQFTFFSSKSSADFLSKINMIILNKNIKKYQSIFFLLYLLIIKKNISTISKIHSKYLESNKFCVNSKTNNQFSINALVKNIIYKNNQIPLEKIIDYKNNEKIMKKKQKNRLIAYTTFYINKFKIFQLNKIPIDFMTYFDPSYLIIIQIKYMTPEKTFIIKAKITKHKWSKNSLRSKCLQMISIGWNIFKTILIYFKEDFLNRKRYQKYLTSNNSNFVCFHSPFVEIGLSLFGIYEENMIISTRSQGSNFNILFTGKVVSNNKKLNIFKKLKLKGLIFNSFKKTAFVKNMFSSELETSRFIGSLIQTTVGIRGIIKKHIINGPGGSFRATFEQNVIPGEIVFLRIWCPVEIVKRIQYKIFFHKPYDLREIPNVDFLNYSKYIESEKNIKILKNFEFSYY